MTNAVARERTAFMKKLMSALLCLLMLCPCALADGADGLPALMEWPDCEAMIAENGWTGAFEDIEEAGIRLWVPDVYTANESLDNLMKMLSAVMTEKMDELDQLSFFSRIWMISESEESKLTVASTNLEKVDGRSEGVQVTINGLEGLLWTNRIEKALSLPQFGFYAVPQLQIWLEISPRGDSPIWVVVTCPSDCSEPVLDMARCILSSVQPLD